MALSIWRSMKMSLISLLLTRQTLLVRKWHGFSCYTESQAEAYHFLVRLGPAEFLFEPPYYKAMRKALKDDGILCTQGEL